MSMTMSRKVTVLTDATFNDYITRHPWCIVDFWAEWCVPCGPMSRVVEALGSELVGRVDFASVDMEENRVNAARLGIMALPTNVIFRNGTVVDAIVGSMPKQVLLERIRSRLNDPAYSSP